MKMWQPKTALTIELSNPVLTAKFYPHGWKCHTRKVMAALLWSKSIQLSMGLGGKLIGGIYNVDDNVDSTYLRTLSVIAFTFMSLFVNFESNSFKLPKLYSVSIIHPCFILILKDRARRYSRNFGYFKLSEWKVS